MGFLTIRIQGLKELDMRFSKLSEYSHPTPGGNIDCFMWNAEQKTYYIYSDSLSKQCRPWSDAAFCGIWSGSTLFAIHQAVLDLSIISKMDLFKFQD